MFTGGAVSDCILKLERIKKYFSGVRALDGVDFCVRAGEVHALIGENGAGKSTLVKVMTGVYSPDGGKIFLDGRERTFRSPHDARNAGIAVIHQEATMFSDLSVMENIFMGHHLRTGKLKRLDWKSMKERTEQLLVRLDLDIAPVTPVKELSVAQRHMVEIAKALSEEARIVIMDEPTSALSMREVEDLYRIIEQLKKDGTTIVFISHKFDEIFRIADTYTVLRDGKFVGEGNIADSTIDSIVTMMVGRNLTQMFPKVHAERGESILKVEGLSCEGVFHDISFDLHRGEILGFFGLIGAGRSEVMRTIFGIDVKTAGSIEIKGEKVDIGDPRAAMDRGLVYVPEDRHTQGAILDLPIRTNISLPNLSRISRLGFYRKAEERALTDEYATRLNVKAVSWDQAVGALSGGNQQKVVLAKWLAMRPDILILDEPTKGIDVATKAAVHEFMGQLVRQGLAIILVSSELPEVLGMADEVVVMYDGRITARFSREKANPENVIRAAVGSA